MPMNPTQNERGIRASTTTIRRKRTEEIALERPLIIMSPAAQPSRQLIALTHCFNSMHDRYIFSKCEHTTPLGFRDKRLASPRPSKPRPQNHVPSDQQGSQQRGSVCCQRRDRSDTRAIALAFPRGVTCPKLKPGGPLRVALSPLERLKLQRFFRFCFAICVDDSCRTLDVNCLYR